MNNIFIPNEIYHEIFSYCDIKTIVKSCTVSKEWHDLMTDFVADKIEFTPTMLSLIVNHNVSFIFKIYQFLTQKNKNLVYNFYSYLGKDEMINYCLDNGAFDSEKNNKLLYLW